VDWENLIAEIEDMGRSEPSLKSNLIVVLVYLSGSSSLNAEVVAGRAA